jgi:hypothetical protein
MKLKINNLKDDSKILWKKMSCTCNKDNVMESHPVKVCLHCKYEICENSMPRKSFTVNEPVLDKDNRFTGKVKTKEITEITIVRGSHDDIQGWFF